METPKREAMAAARALLKKGGTAALSVIDLKGGAPFTTLVNVAVDETLAPVILTSALSHHTQCLLKDPRASLMVHAELPSEGDPLTGFRVSLSGVFAADDSEALRNAFLARHPYAALYADFGDFGFWRMAAEHAHIIAGFGRAYSVRFADIAAG